MNQFDIYLKNNIVNFYSRNKEYKSRKDEWFQTETKQSKFL